MLTTVPVAAVAAVAASNSAPFRWAVWQQARSKGVNRALKAELHTVSDMWCIEKMPCECSGGLVGLPELVHRLHLI